MTNATIEFLDGVKHQSGAIASLFNKSGGSVTEDCARNVIVRVKGIVRLYEEWLHKSRELD